MLRRKKRSLKKRCRIFNVNFWRITSESRLRKRALPTC